MMESASAPRERAISKLAELINGIKIAMLTTTDNRDGSLVSRPMGTQKVEFDGQLWFFTEDDSPKADQVQQDRQVNVSYADNGANRYVSVSGTARLVDDRAKMEELWNPVFKVWFPDGLETPNLALLCVDVERAEYWESDGKIASILQFAKALITREEADDMGRNERLQLK